MAQGKYHVGKKVRASIGGTFVNLKNLTVTRSIDTVDVTNSESSGYQEMEGSIFRSSGDATVVYAGAAPPAMTLGSEINLLHTVNGSNRTAEVIVVTGINDTSAVEGSLEVGISWVSTGMFYTYTPA